MDASADFRRFPGGKNAFLFEALHRRYGIDAVHHPSLPLLQRRRLQLANIHPRLRTWRRRFNLDPRTFEARSARARAMLADSPARLLVQIHTLVAPPSDRPWVLHTDTAYRQTERFFPSGAPLRGRDRERFLALETAFYRGAEALFPRSAWLARSFVEDYGCDPDRVVVVGGGANFPIVPLTRRRWDSQTALFVGREWERKGGPDLLRAWEQVHRALPHARLQVAGLPTRPRRLPPRVEWLGMIHDRQRLLDLFERASLFVMPSDHEPWGHVFLEAMASGLPCIGTRTCAMPEIIQEGRTGLLVPQRDHRALAAALLTLLDDPATCEAMGGAGQARIVDEWTWDRVVDRMAPVIERVIGARS